MKTFKIFLVITCIVSLFVAFTACKKKETSDNGTNNKDNVDICKFCSQNPLHTLDNGVSILTSKIITPNGDAINDYFSIRIITTDEEDALIPDFSLIIYDGENKQIATFFQYLFMYDDSYSIWDCKIDGKKAKTGLYSYKLTINEKDMFGYFIITNCDIDFSDSNCFDECLKYPEYKKWLYFDIDPCITKY